MGFTESFAYDQLNRLTGVSGPSAKSYAYDIIGNITYKSDVGAYAYGASNAGPHAVTSAGGNTYSYDANGSMVSGGGRTISYTSFNKPGQVQTATATTVYGYDANHNRLTKYDGATTTTYIGKLYERVNAGGVIKHKHYVYAGSRLISTVEQVGAVELTKYMHADHLGSITAVTDGSGNVLERLSFDAFGNPRNPDGTDVTGLASTQTTRGYTGHEMDAESGLINMNARLYDPVLGRFLSADTIVPNPGDTQAFNRYSYVINNPLKYVDPSGHFFGVLFAWAAEAFVTWLVEGFIVEIVLSTEFVIGTIAVTAAAVTIAEVSAAGASTFQPNHDGHSSPLGGQTEEGEGEAGRTGHAQSRRAAHIMGASTGNPWNFEATQTEAYERLSNPEWYWSPKYPGARAVNGEPVKTDKVSFQRAPDIQVDRYEDDFSFSALFGKPLQRMALELGVNLAIDNPHHYVDIYRAQQKYRLYKVPVTHYDVIEGRSSYIDKEYVDRWRREGLPIRRELIPKPDMDVGCLVDGSGIDCREAAFSREAPVNRQDAHIRRTLRMAGRIFRFQGMAIP